MLKDPALDNILIYLPQTKIASSIFFNDLLKESKIKFIC